MDTFHPVFFLEENYMNNSYYIHSRTKNISFVEMYRILKDQGITNNKFFLKIYDKDLIDIDPYDPNLTQTYKKKILIEVTRNPWYYLREIIRLPASGAHIPFALHRGNLALIWSVLNNFNPILILPRQQGKTFGVISILQWVYDFGTKNTEILFSNKSLGDSINNLKRFKDTRELLPEYLRDAILNKKDTNNIEGILSFDRNNSIKTKGQPKSKVDADKQGRGMTSPFLWFDEFAFLSYNDIVLKAASPAYSKAAKNAENSNKPYSKIITTTPNNIDSGSGSVCYSMLNNAAPFTEQMYDWNRSTCKDFIKNNSLNDYLYIAFTWRQLGLDEEWYEEQKRALLNDEKNIAREVDIVWTNASDSSVFDESQLSSVAMYNSKIDQHKVSLLPLDASDRKDAITGSVDTKYLLKVYTPLDPKKRYFIGVDTAGGVQRDSSAFTVVDPITLKPVAIFRNNKINVNLYSTLLENLITDVIPDSILFIERNSLGKGVVDLLVRRCPEKIFYNIKIADKSKSKLFMPRTDNITYGIDNTPESRSKMLDILSHIVYETPDCLAYDELFLELKTLVYTNSGKIEHDTGCHDDVLFSYLFVRYAINYSTTISRFMPNRNKQLQKNISSLVDTAYFSDLNEINENIHSPEEVENLSLKEIIEKSNGNLDISGFLKTDTSKKPSGRKINASLLGELFKGK